MISIEWIVCKKQFIEMECVTTRREGELFLFVALYISYRIRLASEAEESFWLKVVIIVDHLSCQ